MTDPTMTTIQHTANRAAKCDAKQYPRRRHLPAMTDADAHRDELDAMLMDLHDAEIQAIIDGAQWVDTTEYPM